MSDLRELQTPSLQSGRWPDAVLLGALAVGGAVHVPVAAGGLSGRRFGILSGAAGPGCGAIGALIKASAVEQGMAAPASG